jgi:hypothetical protein
MIAVDGYRPGMDGGKYLPGGLAFSAVQRVPTYDDIAT